MPLHDHFHPPWSVQRPWEGFHSAWATAIAFHLNIVMLPDDYFAMPLVQAGRDTCVLAPSQPTRMVPLEAAGTDAFEVQVLRNLGGPQLRAAIELVSPSNKDRPASRRAFAAKCAGYLRRNVSVIVIDVVTERPGDLHAEIMKALDRTENPDWASPTGLYAAAYRGVWTTEPPELQVWPHALAIGQPLPELPLWLEGDLSVPLPLEESYTVTCGSLRMRG